MKTTYPFTNPQKTCVHIYARSLKIAVKVYARSLKIAVKKNKMRCMMSMKGESRT